MQSRKSDELPESPDEVLIWVRRIALSLSKRYRFSPELTEELISEGLVRYFEVFPRLDGRRHLRESSRYMYLHVRGRMLDSISRVGNQPVSARKQVKSSEGKVQPPLRQISLFNNDLEERLSDPHVSDDQIDAKRELEKIGAFLDTLPPLARSLIYEPELSGLTLEDIAKDHGISKSTAHRQKKRLLSQIRHVLKSMPGLGSRKKESETCRSDNESSETTDRAQRDPFVVVSRDKLEQMHEQVSQFYISAGLLLEEIGGILDDETGHEGNNQEEDAQGDERLSSVPQQPILNNDSPERDV